jgi:putative NADH-flavin reductase
MLIVIFGASGKVGRLAVAEALARGHQVRAFVHRHHGLKPHPQLTIIKGDIHDPSAAWAAVSGCQAVISTLGSWGTPSKDIVSSGMRHIIPAMEQQGVERIVTLTGAEAWDSTDHPNLGRRLSHALARLGAGKILADGEEHIRLLRQSQLDWTALRSPVMTGSARIFYKLSLQPLQPWQTIPRRAVVKALIDQLDGAGYSQAAPFLRRY